MSAIVRDASLSVPEQASGMGQLLFELERRECGATLLEQPLHRSGRYATPRSHLGDPTDAIRAAKLRQAKDYIAIQPCIILPGFPPPLWHQPGRVSSRWRVGRYAFTSGQPPSASGRHA
jgi:hypothetical protein